MGESIIFRGKKYNLKQVMKKSLPLFVIAILVILFSFFAIFKLGSIPGLYIDEVNYMNEVISKVSYGTDIQGLNHPIYFASVWGQGQSILYSWIVVPLIKIFGFSIFLFRIPMVFFTILTILSIILAIYFSSKDKLLAVCVTVSLVTAPWLFISSRWVLDANISPIFIMLGLVSVYVSMIFVSKRRYVFLIISAILLALSAYGYIASWIYLPFLVVAIATISLYKKWFSIKEILVWLAIIFVIALPLIVFAYRVNIQHVDKFTKFLFFDFPYLKANRVSSLISFKGSILVSIKANIITGIQQVVLGSDNLPQNSVYPYGAIFPLTILFTAIGIFGKKALFDENAAKFRNIVILSLISFIPGMLVIKPNYNHWNFLWFPLVVLTGYGFYLSFKMVDRASWSVFLLVPVLVFGLFISNSYFGFENQKNHFNNAMGSVEETQNINKIMNKKFDHKKLYIESLPETFNMFRLVQNPINSSEYLKMQKDVTKGNGSIVPAPEKSYGYLRDVNNISEASDGDLAMIYEDDISTAGAFLSQGKWNLVTNSDFNHRKVKVFQKE